jgi:predicted metal-dependent hydrolase
MKKELFIEEIGTVAVCKKKGVKRISISIRPSRPVNVTLPYSVSFDEALKFVMQNKSKIVKAKQRFEQKMKLIGDFHPESIFTTKSRKLVFQFSECTRVKLTDTEIIAEYKHPEVFKNPDYQLYLRKALTETLKMEASVYLPERTEYLAKKHGFKFRKVSIGNAKTRWGSCSSQNDIKLNIHLLRLPDALCDYVILHELCHTKEKNHGKDFWSLLDKVTGNAKKLDKELNKYRLNF